MKHPGAAILARRWSRWAATVGVIVLATRSYAVSPETSHLMPANYTAPQPAPGSAAATPPTPAGQVGLYENESIRRTPVSGGTASGGAGSAAPTGAAPWSFSRIPAALAVVLVLIVGLRWLMAKMSGTSGRKGSTRAMRVLARSTVSPRQQLMLIQIGKRLVLVGNSGGAMSPLCQIDDPTEVASLVGQIRAEQTTTPVSSFKSLFGRANDDYEAPPSMFKPQVRHEPADEQADEPVGQSAAADLLDRRETRDEVMMSGDTPMPPAEGVTDQPATKPVADDPAVGVTSGELSELMAKVRRMSQGFQR